MTETPLKNPKITAAAVMAQLAKRPPSPEAWSVRGLRLPAADAIAKLKDYKPLSDEDKKAGKGRDAVIRGDLPDEDRDWLIRKIEKSSFAGVIVDAHEHFHDGATIFNGSVTKLF